MFRRRFRLSSAINALQSENTGKRSLGERMGIAAAVTAISCLLAYAVIVPLSESLLGHLFSAPETSDFTMSDMFIQFADARPVRHLDDRIVIVDIGYAGRAEIADALEVVAVAEPKAVGLDVNFPVPRQEDIDAALLEGILMQKDIVLPVGLEQEDDGFHIDEKPFFFEDINSPSIHYAVANLPAKSARSSIREFETGFPLADGSVMPSYVTELARTAAPREYERLRERGRDRETIDYASREFTVIPIDEVLDRADELTDKFVLMGSMSDAYDLHATPLNSNISGILIHATALGTLLDGTWYRYVPDAADYAASVVLCFLLAFAAVSLPGRGKGLVIHAAQLLLLVLVVWFGYTLFIDYRIIVDLSYTFFVVGIGLMVLECFHGVRAVAGWWHERNSAKHSENNPETAVIKSKTAI